MEEVTASFHGNSTTNDLETDIEDVEKILVSQEDQDEDYEVPDDMNDSEWNQMFVWSSPRKVTLQEFFDVPFCKKNHL